MYSKYLFIGGPWDMETRGCSGSDIFEMALPASQHPVEDWSSPMFLFPTINKHIYYRRKFTFGNTIRSIYVHGDMKPSEYEEAFFAIITKLFDMFVEA